VLFKPGVVSVGPLRDLPFSNEQINFYCTPLQDACDLTPRTSTDDGGPSCVVVQGASGIGKTHSVHQLAKKRVCIYIECKQVILIDYYDLRISPKLVELGSQDSQTSRVRAVFAMCVANAVGAWLTHHDKANATNGSSDRNLYQAFMSHSTLTRGSLFIPV